MIDNDRSRTAPPLLPEIEALLAQERTIECQPEVVKARALARARSALREGVAFDWAPKHSGLSGARWLVFAAAGSVVLVAGIAAAFQMMRKAPAVTTPGGRAPAHVRLAESTPAPSEAAVNKEPASPDVAPASAPAKTTGANRRPGLANRNEGGIEELRLLDRARQSDTHGDYTAVLAAVAEHERNFPAGRLSEEREVLRVKALVGLGRGSDARYAAVRFHRQYPRSVLSKKIDEMLASLQ